MSKAQDQISEVPFTREELAAIERILWGYGHYLQKSPALAKHAQWVASLEQIRERVAVQLASDDVKGVFLNRKDIEQLLEAMLAFGVLVKRIFPPNEERDTVIESVNLWCLHLTGSVTECEV